MELMVVLVKRQQKLVVTRHHLMILGQRALRRRQLLSVKLHGQRLRQLVVTVSLVPTRFTIGYTSGSTKLD